MPLLIASVLVLVVQAVRGGLEARFTSPPGSRLEALRLRALTTLLHLVQPLARLAGRLRFQLNPWRRRGVEGFRFPSNREYALWSERWRDAADRLREIEDALLAQRAVVLRGGDFDRWDLEVRDGILGSVQLLVATEEHGGGKQLVRLRTRRRVSRWAVLLVVAFTLAALAAAGDGAWLAAVLLAAPVGYLVQRVVRDCGASAAVIEHVVAEVEARQEQQVAAPFLPPPPPTSGSPTDERLHEELPVLVWDAPPRTTGAAYAEGELA